MHKEFVDSSHLHALISAPHKVILYHVAIVKGRNLKFLWFTVRYSKHKPVKLLKALQHLQVHGERLTIHQSIFKH